MQNACTDECAVARNFKPQLDHALRLTQPCFATGGITFDPLQVSQKLRFITGGSRRTSRLCGCWRRCNRYGACHGGHRKGCFALGDADRCFCGQCTQGGCGCHGRRDGQNGTLCCCWLGCWLNSLEGADGFCLRCRPVQQCRHFSRINGRGVRLPATESPDCRETDEQAHRP